MTRHLHGPARTDESDHGDRSPDGYLQYDRPSPLDLAHRYVLRIRAVDRVCDQGTRTGGGVGGRTVGEGSITGAGGGRVDQGVSHMKDQRELHDSDEEYRH